MTAVNPPQIKGSPEDPRLLDATAALRTGLFYPIENLDPDIARTPRIAAQEPTLFARIFRRSNAGG